jgi:quercetin dioxygenase-like cupin family protein
MAATSPQQGKTRHVYDLGALAGAPAAPCSAAVAVDAHGVTIGGGRASVALLRVPGGSGCGVQTRAAEKFYFVLEGRIDADVGGRIVAVPAGHALHLPAGAPHALRAAADCAFIVAESRAAGAPATEVWHDGRPAMIAAHTAPPASGALRHVYPVDALDAVPPGASSAKVVPKNYVSGKSSSFGAALSGASLHIGVIHKARGSGAKLHTHPNEQFNVVLAGRMLGEIDGAPMDVAPLGLVHMPPGVRHCTMASAEGDITVFVVKDTSHGLSGPPVDGIEDGPRYLPGFGPQGAGNQ